MAHGTPGEPGADADPWSPELNAADYRKTLRRAEHYGALIKALASVLSNGYDIPGSDEIPDGDWGITAETKADAQAVLDKARKGE